MTEGRNTNYYAVDGLIMQGEHIQYVTDVKANAIGYRYLADNIG